MPAIYGLLAESPQETGDFREQALEEAGRVLRDCSERTESERYFLLGGTMSIPVGTGFFD